MCGLVFVRSLDNMSASGRVWKRYLTQKQRGKEGFGFLAINDDSLGYHRFRTEEETQTLLDKQTAKEILFHHRYPTSTANVPEAAHPILVRNGKLKHNYYVVHNGVIRNADDLKAKHEKDGFRYRTEVRERTEYKVKGRRYYSEVEDNFNDSEAFAVDLALVLSGRQEEIESRGSIAFICLETDKNDKPLFLHYGRGSNPLIIEKQKELVALKSMGDGESLDGDVLYSFCYATGKTEQRDLALGWAISQVATTYYGSYGSHTPIGFKTDKANADDEEEDEPLKDDGFGGERPDDEIKALPGQTSLYDRETGIITYADLEAEAEIIEADIEAMEQEIDFYHQEKLYSEAHARRQDLIAAQKRLENIQIEMDVYNAV